ncbi:two-partner secretion domain-containing protein [Phormidesmis sp. 146-33]
MIAKSRFSRGWQWKIGGCAALVGTLLIGVGKGVLAQIVPDNTLGRESSVVTPNVTIQGIPSIRIEGGAIRGANLFHSFEQFNIREGQGAYFTNPGGIDNILSRVTGANRSEILGRLGVLGTANLFLINPKGIVFGSAASLDVRGSFLATTANAIKLGETGLFSASQPATSTLLNISPSALWFNAVAAQPIVNRSQAQSTIGQLNSANLAPGLQVQPDRTLALVGGDVFLQGRLTAAGGRIELGSVGGVGQISLTQSGNRFVLGYDSITDFGKIVLSNGAFVDASGARGDIQIRGAQLEMEQSSNIWADTLGAGNGGEIRVHVAEVNLSGSSIMSADVVSTATGTGGNVTINTGRLRVRDGARVSASTIGSGKGGNLQITASDAVEVIGAANGQGGRGLTTESFGSGNAGNLTIDTKRLLVRDQGAISTTAFSLGKGGNLQITAFDSIDLIGTSADGRIPSALLVQTQGSGDAGNLTINTRQLRIRDGARISASTFNVGKGGNSQIDASDSVEVIGTSVAGLIPSGLFIQSASGGDAGNLTINTTQLRIRDGAKVSGTVRDGKGGKLQINASDSVEVSGVSPNGRDLSGLTTESAGSGDAGSLTINTGRLIVSGGVSALTAGRGKGGNLQINASNSVEVSGSANGQGVSGLLTQTQGSGDAGNLTIDTGRLQVNDGAVVLAGTFGTGKGGNLQINASESVEVNKGLVSTSTSSSGKGGNLQIKASGLIEVIGTSVNDQRGLFAESAGSGSAGDIKIDAGGLLVRDRAALFSRSSGTGAAGNVSITARDTLRTERSTIRTDSNQTQGGAITIAAGKIRLFDDSDIRSNVASGADNGGAITLTANSILAFKDSDILASARDGTGGNITFNTPAFFGENYRPARLETNPDTLNNNSRVDINATGAVSGIITLPDVSFIQNSLTELPDNQINTDSILANSCIVRRDQPTQGRFTITGTGGFPQRPGEAQSSSFPTVSVETLPSDRQPSPSSRAWRKGDPIVEPQGIYRLPNGKLVLSRNCF